jgi:MSHA biogenesis protein MshL
MNKMPFSFSLVALALLLGGCVTYQHPDPAESKDALKQAQQQAGALTVPDSVQDELLPKNPMPVAPTAYVNERRFRIAAKDVEASEFFASLMKDGRYSVAVHPGVEGRINLDLREVTLPEVLDTVADMYGYDIRRTGTVYHIYPAGLRTESFPVNYLMLTRQGMSRTSITSGGVSDQSNNNNSSNNSNSTNSSSNNNSQNSNNGSSGNSSNNGTVIETGSQSNFWKDLDTALQHLVGSGQGRAVILNPQAGLVTVRGMPDDLKAVKEFLGQSERQLKRQVILETKIMEVRLSEGYQQGIEWNNLSAQWNSGKGVTSAGSLVGLPAVTNTIANLLGGGAGLQFSDGNFEAVVNLLKTQGDVNTLSSPRVTATNNQKAVIKVGSDEYFVTGISSDTVVTSGNPVVTPNIELTPFFSGVALDVMPQIDDQGNVLMHIHPSVIDVTEQKKTIDLGSLSGTGTSTAYNLPMAYSNIRESDTVVQAKSGDVIVIGGLMRINKEQKVSKVPWIGDIPWVGEAFTNRADSTYKTELVIMLKPQVIEGDTWQRELQRSGELLDKWYPEGR